MLIFYSLYQILEVGNMSSTPTGVQKIRKLGVGEREDRGFDS